jgi:hypothetical protein
VFTSPDEEPMDINLKVSLGSRDPVSKVEVIRNGEVALAVAVAGEDHSIRLPTITFDNSGWFLIRAITDLEHTFRFASSAPYYVEVGSGNRHTSRQSAEFFVDWITERIGRVPLKLNDSEQLDEVLAYHRDARDYFQRLANEANAE